jgi:hypothetical protein
MEQIMLERPVAVSWEWLQQSVHDTGYSLVSTGSSGEPES